MASWVDISTWTDACTHSKQGVGTQMSWLGHKHSAIQEYPCFPINMHRGLRWYWESGGHAYTYWCIYIFYPRCGNRSGVIQVGPPFRAGITIWGGTSIQRLDLQLEVGPPIGGGTLITGGPPIGGLTSNGSTHLWSELPPPISTPTSDWRSHLKVELPPPIRPTTSDWWVERHTKSGPHAYIYWCMCTF